MRREYYLPDSATGQTAPLPPTSFGALPTSARLFSLWSSAAGTENLLLQFISPVPLEKDIRGFGHYTLWEFDPTRLPVAVESWTPYRAKITSPKSVWLETPRLFVEGYRAVVNDREVPVARSPGGLVMLPLDAGDSRVQLTYPGSPLLRFAYYLGLAAWCALALAGLGRLRRARKPAVAA